MAASGGAACGSRADRVNSALTGGDGGGSQPAVHELVNAILQLGYLPVQSSRSTPEEERLAAGLRRAQKAGALNSQQEARLRELPSAMNTDLEDSVAAAGTREAGPEGTPVARNQYSQETRHCYQCI